MDYEARKWAHDPKDVPEGEHYAILYFSSIFVPGDERSRTNPGHGYGERNEPTVEYVVFKDRASWEKQVKEHMTVQNPRNNWKAIKVTPAVVETKITLNISGA